MQYSFRCLHTTSRARWLRLPLALGSALAADQVAGAAPAEALAGRWDLTIQDANQKQLPSWLELRPSRSLDPRTPPIHPWSPSSSIIDAVNKQEVGL